MELEKERLSSRVYIDDIVEMNEAFFVKMDGFIMLEMLCWYYCTIWEVKVHVEVWVWILNIQTVEWSVENIMNLFDSFSGLLPILTSKCLQINFHKLSEFLYLGREDKVMSLMLFQLAIEVTVKLLLRGNFSGQIQQCSL